MAFFVIVPLHMNITKQKKYTIIGNAPSIIALKKQIQRLGSSKLSVLIEGETGSGKELVAQNIHAQGNGNAPFIAINCASIPSNLTESFLFGHERGAFTGADQRFPGMLEQASGGTLFLDELASLPMHIQKQFLRALETKEVRPLGSKRTVPVNFHLLSASNVSLESLVNQGIFSMDLFFRINGFTINVPALRSRMGDMEALIKAILPHRQVREDIVYLLKQYSWPGNVRELRNMLESMSVFSPGENPICLEDIPESVYKKLLSPSSLCSNPLHLDSLAVQTPSIKEMRQEKNKMEEKYLRQAYEKSLGNISSMARNLKVDRSHLHQKLVLHGIHQPRSQK